MKKIISLLMCLVMCVSLFAGMELTAAAAGDSLMNATPISFGSTQWGTITSASVDDFYRITLSASGRVTLNVSAYIDRTDYYIYDANGNKVWSKTWCGWNDNIGLFTLNEAVDLKAGTYYVSIGGYYDSSLGNYSMRLVYTNASESHIETLYSENNSIATADDINVNKNYRGQIAKNDQTDIFKFTLGASGRVVLKVSAAIDRTDYYIYDANGNKVWSKTWCGWNENTKLFQMTENVDLIKGVYYLSIGGYYDSSTGNYNYSLGYTATGETHVESQGGNANNSMAEADGITLGKTYTGLIAQNDQTDIYQFTVSSYRTVKIGMVAYIERTNYYLYDQNGNTVWSKTWVGWNENSKVMKFTENVSLTKGTYYLCVQGYYNTSTGKYKVTLSNYCNHKYTTKVTQKATLKSNGVQKKTCKYCGKSTKTTIKRIKSVKPSTTQYDYSGKTKKPSVVVKNTAGTKLKKNVDYTVKYYGGRKNPGRYKIVVKFKGKYSGSKTVYFVIAPKEPGSMKVSYGKTTIKSTWSKSKGATGYYVELRNSSGWFGSGKAIKRVYTKSKSYTFKGLKKGKLYEVRVGSYKTINGKKYLSDYVRYSIQRTKR